MRKTFQGLYARAATPSAVLIGTTAAINVLRIGNTMLLTRLLAPRDFGLVGIIISALYIVNMVTDTGYQAFVVRDERGDDRRFLDVVWTLHVIRGLGITATVMVIAGPLAAVIDKRALVPLMIAAAPIMAIDGLTSTAPFTAVRHGNVRRLSLIDLAGTLTQMATGLVAGAILHNAVAVIIAMYANSIVKTGASYLLFPDTRRRFAFDGTLSGELWRFSRVIAASSIITLVISQVDKLLLARLMSLAEFGVYTIASNLAAAPAALAMIYVARIVYPQVAREARAGPEHHRTAIYGARGTIFLGFLFAAGGLIGSAPLVVRAIYDPRYAGAAPYLSILGISAAFVLLTRSISESLVAIGRTRAILTMNVARLIWLIPIGGLALAFYGAFGVIVTLGLIELPAYAYGLFALGRMRLLDPRRELLAVQLVVAGVLVGYAAVLAVGYVRPA